MPDWVEEGLEWRFAGTQTLDVGSVSRQRIVARAVGLTQLYYDARDGRMIGLYQEEQTPNGALDTSLEAVN